MSAGRSWCFTLHGESAEECIQAGINLGLENNTRYYTYQVEQAPSTGRFHLQGYVVYDNTKRFSTVQKLIPRAHLEQAKGSAGQNRTYCQKTESRVPGTEPREGGVIPAQGKRTDITSAVEAVIGGASKEELAHSFPEQVVKYGKGFERLREWGLSGLRRTEPPVVDIRWGPPGTGKTRWAYDTYGADSVYVVVDSGTRFWWDGYEPGRHTCVLFDDYRGGHSHTQLLQWLDRYDSRGEVKGGSVPMLFTHAVITSNYRPEEWEGWDRRLGALLRRVTNVTHVTEVVG